VDRKLRHFERGEMATVLLAVFEASLSSVTFSAAGHPVPVMVEGDAPACFVDVPIDPPLGVGPPPRRRATTVALEPDTVLCLYTDGLVERRGISLDDRFDLLCESVVRDAPEGVCAKVMSDLIGVEYPKDDVSLLVVRRTDAETYYPLEIHVPAQPSSLREIRAALRRWLASIDAREEEVHDIVVAVGEATANAVEHAYGAAGGTVVVRAELQSDDVFIRISDMGRWRAPRGVGRGRGTLIMETTSDEFRIEHRIDGTDVFLRHHLQR